MSNLSLGYKRDDENGCWGSSMPDNCNFIKSNIKDMFALSLRDSAVPDFRCFEILSCLVHCSTMPKPKSTAFEQDSVIIKSK